MADPENVALEARRDRIGVGEYRRILVPIDAVL
jgi:hypothetical protein